VSYEEQPPSNRQRAWDERQRRAAERRPRIRVESCEVRPLATGEGYAATITGFNLHGVISPPRITVGGVALQRMRFETDGRTVRGVLAGEPDGDTVVIDYGFARAEAAVVDRNYPST
jgi:hypothetical protein